MATNPRARPSGGSTPQGGNQGTALVAVGAAIIGAILLLGIGPAGGQGRGLSADPAGPEIR